MHISLIVAMDQQRVIGRQGTLPWRLPKDLRHFKKTTMGKPLIMGRRTFESIGRPLPGRANIVLTRDRNFSHEGCLIAHDPAHALALAGEVDEVMIGGGTSVYEVFLPQTTRMYLTMVEANVGGDTFFPEVDWSAWTLIEEEAHGVDERHRYDFRFRLLERASASSS